MAKEKKQHRSSGASRRRHHRATPQKLQKKRLKRGSGAPIKRVPGLRRKIRAHRRHTPHTPRVKVLPPADTEINLFLQKARQRAVSELTKMDTNAFSGDTAKLIREKRRQMHDAADRLDFETAALIRDEIQAIERSSRDRSDKV